MDIKILLKYIKKLPGKWLVAVILIIWMLAVGLRLIPVSLALVLTIVLVVVWLVYLLLKWIQSKGKGPEAEIVPELAEFEEKLTSSIKTAKNTPWYLVIGPSGCGKTSLIRNSDLDFSYIDSSQQPEQGIEKTKNCDLFYTRQGIILDTTGRYVSLNKEARVRTEWLGLLSLLRKHRKARPIEGLVVAVDISRLSQSKESVIKEEARKIREGITDAIERLEITFPVYLMFTKCDAIYGFDRFFGDLTDAEREQVWGATLGGSQQEDPQAAFRTECRALFQSLCSHRMAKLGSATGQSGSTVYAFPMEFDSVCERLAPFVDELFHVVSDEKPVFRGFYFTSGARGGNPPIDFMLEDVAKSLSSQPPPLAEQSHEDRGKEGAYFIRELFQRVIFPDQGLHRPTTGAERRRTRMRLGFCGIAIVALAILGIVFGVSYIKNRNLMTETEIAAASVNSISGNTEPVYRLERFERLRRPIVRLEKFALFSLPWRSHRNEVAYNARKLYLSKNYGSTAGAQEKLTRRVELEVKVYKSDVGRVEYIEKAEIKAAVSGKEDKTLQTNKDGTAKLKVNIEDGKVDVAFSTDYELTGYEVQREQIYQIQPGEHVNSRDIQFVFSKSGRAITVHCTDQFGEDLPGVPVSVIEKADESKKYGPASSNEKGIASLSLEAPENSVLLVYYSDSPASYPEEQPDTVTIQAGKSKYSLDKQLRRKLEISVIAVMKSADGSTQQAMSGVPVSIGGTTLGLTDNSGSWNGPGDTVPTRENVTATPTPRDVTVETTASGYSIKLEYGLPEKLNEISVIASGKKADGSSQQAMSGVIVSVAGRALGTTDSSGRLTGSSSTVPTVANVTATPLGPDRVTVDGADYVYSIVLEYILPDKPPPVIKLDAATPADIEVWMYIDPGDDNVFDSSRENDRMEFESDGKQIRLVRLKATKGEERDLELPKEAENHQLLLWHPDYWPYKIQWRQTAEPILMTSIKQERSFVDFGKVERDGSEYYFQNAQEYHSAYNLSQAITDYLNAIRLAPRLKYYLRLGWAHYEDDQTDKALKEANRGMDFRLVGDPEADERYLKEQIQNLRDQIQ